MGWSFSTRDIGRKAHIESLTNARHFSEGYVPLMHRVVGNHVWQLVQRPDGTKFITLDLIAKERGGGWGYKGLSEDMGPYDYDCPLSLLDKADPPTSQYAAEWREKVRQYHAAKKQRPKAREGLVVQYGSHAYRLLFQYPAPRKGWAVERISDGQRFRMPAAQIGKSTILEAA